MERHKTLKKSDECDEKDTFKDLLEAGAREAYLRPWHRLERGLRLNRLRIFIEEISLQFEMNDDEKIGLFVYLQKALDKKLLNTLKVVQYNQETQRIIVVKGLEIKRNEEGALKWSLNLKKRTDMTRKKGKTDEISSVPS
jgi:hypothetical protein